MDPGELGAVAAVPVLRAPQVPDIMEQPDDQAGRGTLGAQPIGGLRGAIMPGHQPRQRQGHIQGVLPVVVDGIDAEVAGDFSGEHALKLIERAGNRFEREIMPGGMAKLFHSLANRRGGAHLHGAGYVEVI